MSAGAGSAVLKRLAWLNRSGLLAKPLQYSQVKGALDSLGEQPALEVLKELEEEAAGVPDPVEYVKNAAAGAGAGAAPGGLKRKAAGGADDGIVAKRVRLLNGSGQLAQPIDYIRVREALDSLSVGQAMTILKGLEDVAEDVRDPTGYVRTAVRGAGGIVLDEDDEGAADGDSAETPAPAAPRGGWQAAKTEGPGRWSKTEDLTETERIVRHIEWLNRRAGLTKPIDPEEVLPALECIGFKQSMRVLRRLEESAATAQEPEDFVKDLVARAGWIFSKPDIIDDDEKVAKRVAWLNLFGGLMQPIDYAQVADALDGLKVPHAMVLLRELEVQSHTIEDPTEHIKKAVTLAGEDNVHVMVVDEDSSVAQRVSELNQSGRLANAIKFTEVGEDLGKIGDEAAMQLLQEVESKGPSVKDPTGFIRFKLKAKLASLGTTVEAPADDETKILKRIEWLNDYGGLLQDLDYDSVAPTLNAVGLETAMTVLKELEDQRAGVQDPTAFVLGAARTRPARKGPKGKAAATGAADLKTLSRFVSFLNRRPGQKRQVKFGEVASALESLGPRRATRVLQEMQERGLGLEDPVAYIRAAAQRAGPAAAEAEGAGEDDVAKLTKRLQWLNQFGGLAKRISVDQVVGALYCLGLPQSMGILRSLQEKGARVQDPTSFIKTSIQRANGIRVDVKESIKDEDFIPEIAVAEDDEDDDDVVEAFDELDVDLMVGEGEDLADFGAGVVQAKGEEEEEPQPAAAARQNIPSRPARGNAAAGERRVVGGLTGYKKLVPNRPSYKTDKVKNEVKTEMVETEVIDEPAAEPKEVPQRAPVRANMLPITPQEKLIQVRDLAMKHGLDLDPLCLKALSRLPFYKAKDLIDDVLLGGRNRTGVTNPSRYLTIGCQKMSQCLGVEQGLAMELAVSLGVVLNNDCLDELACIPRKESQTIIREVANNAAARKDPIRFIQAEVMKCRAQMDARPWPPAA